MVGYRGKRLIDLTLVVLSAPLWAPLMLAVTLLVWVVEGRPVFFRQLRAGLSERPFRMWKFRTMSDARTADGSLLGDEARTTTLGRFLRGSSLDEVPELFNVL